MKDMPPMEKVEDMTTINDISSEEAVKERKRLLMQKGRMSTLLAGIQNILKRKLGE